MDGNKFRAVLLIVVSAILIPVIYSLYGNIYAGAAAIIAIAAIAVFIILVVKKPKTDDEKKKSDVCSDINSIALKARGKNYVITSGSGFNLEENLQKGLMSYVENGVWCIEDNGEKGDAPIEICVPDGFVPQKLSVSAEDGNVMIKIPSVRKLELKIQGGNAEIYDLKVYSMNIDTGKGSVRAAVKLFGSSEFNCGSGSIYVNIDSDMQNFNFNAETGMGSIKINDEEFNSGRRSGTVDNNSDNVITTRCGMGKIELNFKEQDIK